MIFEIILYTLIVGVVGTGLGGFIGALFKKDSNRTTSLLLSISAGIMLSIVCFDLITSAFGELNSEKYTMPLQVLIVVGFTSIGIIVVYILNYFIDEYSKKRSKHVDDNHPKTHDNIDELRHSDTLVTEMNDKKDYSKKSLLNAGIMMVLAIALHNLPEGISIGSSYAHSTETGFTLALLIALHNIPEGMSISAPLVSGGMSKTKAIILTALSGAPTVIGAIIGYSLGTSLGVLGVAISLALASGAMVYVVFAEIIPQSILMYKSKLPAIFMMIGFLLCIIIIYMI